MLVATLVGDWVMTLPFVGLALGLVLGDGLAETDGAGVGLVLVATAVLVAELAGVELAAGVDVAALVGDDAAVGDTSD